MRWAVEANTSHVPRHKTPWNVAGVRLFKRLRHAHRELFCFSTIISTCSRSADIFCWHFLLALWEKAAAQSVVPARAPRSTRLFYRNSAVEPLTSSPIGPLCERAITNAQSLWQPAPATSYGAKCRGTWLVSRLCAVGLELFQRRARCCGRRARIARKLSRSKWDAAGNRTRN